MDATKDTSPPPPLPGRSAGRGWFAPYLAPLLADRKAAIGLSAAGALQVAAGYFGFRAFPCPMLTGLGVPCPGCGASRACGALLHADWGQYVRMHAMGACFLVAAACFVAAAVLPQRPRERFIAVVAAVESRTAGVPVLLVALFVYWIMRLAYAPAAFAQLMRP